MIQGGERVTNTRRGRIHCHSNLAQEVFNDTKRRSAPLNKLRNKLRKLGKISGRAGHRMKKFGHAGLLPSAGSA